MTQRSTVLAVDAVLQALIGPPESGVQKVIDAAASGEVTIVIKDSALCAALSSVKEGDELDVKRFGKLLRYASIEITQLPTLPFRRPSDEEIGNWRHYALQGGEPATLVPPNG